MTRFINLSFAVVGAILATGIAGLLLIQEAGISGSSVFPMPFLVLAEWAALAIAGAALVTSAELQHNGRHLAGAWAVAGAYIPLILLSGFSFGLYALLSALLLFAPTIILTIRHAVPLVRCLGMLVVGVLANLVFLFALIGANVLLPR